MHRRRGDALMTLLAIMLSTLISGAASAQSAQGKPRTYHPPVKNLTVEKQSYVNVDDLSDWRAWISTNYPDASSSWPADCAKSAETSLKGSAWDYTAKGDFNKAGVPMVLRISFAKAGGSKKIVAKLAVLECRGGTWSRLLALDPDVGMWANGEDLSELRVPKTSGYNVILGTGVKAAPGIQFSVTPVDSQGDGLAEGVDFIYLPDERRYLIDAN